MRKLASIQKILEVKNHPNANRLDIVKVLGWQCVSRRDEFKAGDNCVFFEIDSLIPMKHEWIKFLQNKDKPEKSAKIKSIRLRGEISQGLALPVSILSSDYVIEEGKDVTELLEIQKWEMPEISAQLAGICKGSFPSHTPKSDQQRLQSNIGLLEEFKDKEVYITVKMDGTSFTASHCNGEIDVCSRNLSLKETEDNIYWKMAKKYDIVNKLIQNAQNISIQAELLGYGVQKNPMGLKETELWVFDVYDVDKGRYFEYDAFVDFCSKWNLKMVPIIYNGIFKWNSVDELLDFAKGTYDNGHVREGIVIHPLKDFYSNTLYGRASFKVINNDYLLASKE